MKILSLNENPDKAPGDLVAITGTTNPSLGCRGAAGKREASVGGAGVGARAARKLLAAFGSIEAAREAAALGQLKGHSPAVQKLFLPGDPGSPPHDPNPEKAPTHGFGVFLRTPTPHTPCP